MGEAKRKKWSVNSTILPRERPNFYFVDPADQKKNVDLLNNIVEGKYVLMHGARASGKSTRTWRVMEQLQQSGYLCLYITLSNVDLGANKETFWQSFGSALKEALEDCFGPRGSLQIDTTVPDVKTADDFRGICMRQNELWNLLALKRKGQGQPNFIENRFLVIFIDEFDALVHVSDSTIRDSFLGMIHGIKTSGDLYAVQSVVGVGTFNILSLNTDSRVLSPFNISDAFKNPNFTPEQVTTLFKEFGTEYRLAIPDDVIQDICLNTNGHAGLVNLCGRAIQSLVVEQAHTLKGQLPYRMWKSYSGKPLEMKIAEYRTFDKMLKSLGAAESWEANNLLRTYFLGFRGNVEIESDDECDLANFLVGEGVLLPVEGTGNESKFKMSSPYVDALIRRRILPRLDTACPKTAPVKRTNGTYDILQIVMTAVHYFNKDVLRNAVTRAFKAPKYGRVEGKTLQDVPRESVYDSELYRIFMNWLVRDYRMRITGQWHVVTETDPINPTSKVDHEYFDIVISTRINRQPMIILELMASGVKAEVQKHFAKALKYGSRFDNPEIWVINFTCLDNATTLPVWQNDDELNRGLNVAHFWHDLAFKQMRMCARWLEAGKKVEISDRDLGLQNE
ncbi:hypothetical protein BC937DRAFT_91453 [Endogone sp. FLAS-F59071]|nr:hypothetical protein BC937DRAFT_91453 [Endogone sp. FLAS-F59071]|eukprot:RUS16242.1 hypothetical protein BC937DRAFT_91453 [Endogone sp. FLAS-F59071]